MSHGKLTTWHCSVCGVTKQSTIGDLVSRIVPLMCAPCSRKKRSTFTLQSGSARRWG